MSRSRLRCLAALAAALVAGSGAGPSHAQFMTGKGLAPATENPADALDAKAIIDAVGFDQRLGEALPLDAAVVDEAGQVRRLGDFFGSRPVVFGLVYYRCPVLCSLIERGTAMAARPLDLAPGRDFDVVFVSFDATDTPELAAEARRRTLSAYGKSGDAAGWHFLTAGEESIRAITGAAGFRFVREEATGQFAHAAGIMVATPDGRLSRYLYGAEYAPRDLKLALVESSAGRIGSPVDKLLLYCFRYDAGLGRYTAVSMLALRIAGVATLLALALYFFIAQRRGRRHRRLAAGGAV